MQQWIFGKRNVNRVNAYCFSNAMASNKKTAWVLLNVIAIYEYFLRSQRMFRLFWWMFRLFWWIWNATNVRSHVNERIKQWFRFACRDTAHLINVVVFVILDTFDSHFNPTNNVDSRRDNSIRKSSRPRNIPGNNYIAQTNCGTDRHNILVPT